MHRWIAAAIVLVPLTAQSREPLSPPDLVMEKFAQAWSKDDVNAVATLLTNDVILVDAKPVSGKEAVMAWAKKQMAATGLLTVQSVRSVVGGDVGAQMGRWSLAVSDGKVETGNHTFIVKREKDGWKISAMHINDDSPPPSSASTTH